MKPKKLTRHSVKSPWSARQRAAIAEWRGWEEPSDTSHCEHQMAGLVSKILAKANLEARSNLEELREIWTKAVGSYLAQQSRAEGFRNGVLQVLVLQPTVRFELEGPRKKAILAKVQEYFPEGNVKDIRFLLG